jgi:hypothetical protein
MTFRLDVTYCFVDTNTLLEFQRFDSINWPKLVDANEVCLVVAPAVIREIDQHKYDSSNARRRDRARAVLPVLGSYLEQMVRSGNAVPVRENVTIIALTEKPRIDWVEKALERQDNDDRIIASILTFQEARTPEHLVLVSNDLGIRLKARQRGIDTINPSDYPELIPALPNTSPAEAELRQLKTEIEQLRNRMPKLDFGFWENNTIVHKVECLVDDAIPIPNEYEQVKDNDDLARLMQQKAELLDREIAYAITMGISTKEIDDYRSGYEEYMEDFKKSFWSRWSRLGGSACSLIFALENIGTIMIEGIEIELAFPARSFVLRASDMDDKYFDIEDQAEPEVPWKKVRPVLPSFLNTGWGVYANDLYTPHIPVPIISTGPRQEGWFYNEESRDTIKYISAKLKSGQSEVTESLKVYLPPDTQGGTAVRYTIYTNALPSPITKELHILIKRNGDPDTT